MLKLVEVLRMFWPTRVPFWVKPLTQPLFFLYKCFRWTYVQATRTCHIQYLLLRSIDSGAIGSLDRGSLLFSVHDLFEPLVSQKNVLFANLVCSFVQT